LILGEKKILEGLENIFSFFITLTIKNLYFGKPALLRKSFFTSRVRVGITHPYSTLSVFCQSNHKSFAHGVMRNFGKKTICVRSFLREPGFVILESRIIAPKLTFNETGSPKFNCFIGTVVLQFNLLANKKQEKPYK